MTKEGKTQKEHTLAQQIQGVLFKIFVTFAFIGGAYFTYLCVMFTQENISKKPEGYEWTSPKDLYVTAGSTVLFIVLELTVKAVLPPVFAPICKAQDKTTDRRINKMASYFYKIIFFCMSASWGYSLIKDADWLPWELGGKGDFYKLFDNFPYATHIEGNLFYLTFTIGYHVASLILTLYEPERPDYLDMLIHHTATVYLYLGCYYTNWIEIGTCIAILHDIADITTGLCKLFVESIYLNFAAFWAVVHTFLWVWTRNYMFPRIIYFVYFHRNELSDSFHPFILNYFTFMLSTLAVLHVYWLVLFLNLLLRYSTTGAHEDTHNSPEAFLKNKEKNEKKKN